MTKLKLIAAMAVFALDALNANSASAAITTFATYSAVTSAANMRWHDRTATVGGHLHTTATPGSHSTGAAAVTFDFLAPSLASLRNISADYIFDAVAADSPAIIAGGFLLQPVTGGSFSFIYTGSAPLVIGGKTFSTGANLLSGTFANAVIVGQAGGTSGAMTASEISDGTISYSSDFIEFDNTRVKDFSINLTSITPALSRVSASTAINTFDADSGGAFSADTAALGSTVPEPASWALMVAGFTLVGLRNRRRTACTA